MFPCICWFYRGNCPFPYLSFCPWFLSCSFSPVSRWVSWDNWFSRESYVWSTHQLCFLCYAGESGTRWGYN